MIALDCVLCDEIFLKDGEIWFCAFIFLNEQG